MQNPLNSCLHFQTQKCGNIVDENWSFHSLYFMIQFWVYTKVSIALSALSVHKLPHLKWELMAENLLTPSPMPVQLRDPLAWPQTPELIRDWVKSVHIWGPPQMSVGLNKAQASFRTLVIPEKPWFYFLLTTGLIPGMFFCSSQT